MEVPQTTSKTLNELSEQMRRENSRMLAHGELEAAAIQQARTLANMLNKRPRRS